MSIKQVRLSGQAKDQLIRLKTRTGIQQWNILCRWAFCLSLKQPSPPTPIEVPADSNVEMTWQVFGGEAHELYLDLLKERCERDGSARRTSSSASSSACTCTAESATWRHHTPSNRSRTSSGWRWRTGPMALETKNRTRNWQLRNPGRCREDLQRFRRTWLGYAEFPCSL